ncbi:MAG TPA: choice-of-anchor Q domain-containing protein, partial [Anaerolineales bacterium]|nr:choice-of-anchor Q domain-containing protein [Anaerolineales bacterium]
MKYSKSHILVALLISVLLLAGVPVNPVYASSIIVTNTNDSGVGSLRQALVDIAPGGTITFDSSLSGATIQLAATLTLDKNVTIDGSSLASQVTISGDTDGNGTGNVRVFDVNHNVTATLNNLAITKGTNRNISSEIGGGGISNLGTLTVLNCVFSDNSADRGGGIFNTDGGTLTVLNSTFAHNSAVTDDGGGIANWNGTLTITDSAFSYNSAYYAGGGIFNAGTVTTVLNNTFSNNSAIYGGGIANWYVGIITVTGSTFSNNSSSAYGGGLYINSGTGTVTNSTFSGNTTGLGGGGIYNYGTLTVRNSTVSGNVATSFGGGIFNDRTLNYTNTLIANSTGGDCVNNLGTVDTNTKNLVEDGGCSAGLSGDPNLGTLASNGGSTQTFALLAGSSAIDAGDDASCPITDQRGISRLQGAHCDIGAYEFENSPTTYDAFADFSPVSNPPSGSPWMYGYTWTLGGAFDIYTALRHDIDRELSILWTRPENFITPNVNKNISGVDIINVDGCILHPAITYLNLHPGQNNEFSVLRWTAPVDGTFRIDSAFKSLRFCGQA